MRNYEGLAEIINAASSQIHDDNLKWWVSLESGDPIDRNVGEMLMLVVTE